MTPRQVVLSADDYAIAPGVSRGIVELLDIDRLSATSAIVTGEDWLQSAAELKPLRERTAIGLHLNMTAGTPLGNMPLFAPEGRFPPLSRIVWRSFTGRLPTEEIVCEVGRQLDRFEEAIGAPPDFVDAHHHLHVLPTVRRALFAALRDRYHTSLPLVRNPADRLCRILARRHALRKAVGVALLGHGFARDAARFSIPTNDGFSGYSWFDARLPFQLELERFLRAPGPLHVLMCHPGYPDAALRSIDPLCSRRLEELDAIRDFPGLPALIVRPRRRLDGRIRWDDFI